MKIIRPFDLTKDGVVESNAPSDDYVTWSTVGRDFFTQIDPVEVACSLSDIWIYKGALRPNGAAPSEVKNVDAATGDEITSPIDISGLGEIQAINPSPDGNYVAFFTSSEDWVIFDKSTGTKVYETGGYITSSSGWSPDSGFFCFYGVSKSENLFSVVIVSAADFSETVVSGSDIVNTLLDPYPAGSTPKTESYSVESICASNAAGYFSVSFIQEYFLNDNSYRISKTAVMRLSTAGALAVNEIIQYGPAIASSTPLPEKIYGLVYNATKDQLLAIVQGEFDAFDGTTLADDPDVPNDTGASFKWLYIAKDSSEIITVNQSVQPFVRRYSASTYLIIDDLDAEIGGYTTSRNQIDYSSGYIAFGDPNGGYGLIDKTDGARVTQTNPSVTAGDIYTYIDRNYEALVDNSDRPDLGAVADPPTWLDLGFVNPLRMFDGKLDSRTVSPSPLVIDITTGTLTNGVALFNVLAQTVQVTYTSSTDGLVYDSGEILMSDGAGVSDWYAYFFESYQPRRDVALLDLPAYTDGVLTVTITGIDGDISIGEVVAGTIYQIGDAQYGTSAGILDFSRKEQDQFGNFEIIKRRFSKRVEYDTVIDTGLGGSFQRTLAEYRTTPVVWVGDERLEETIVYGYYRSFDILLSNPAFSNVSISVEGL